MGARCGLGEVCSLGMERGAIVHNVIQSSTYILGCCVLDWAVGAEGVRREVGRGGGDWGEASREVRVCGRSSPRMSLSLSWRPARRCSSSPSCIGCGTTSSPAGIIV